MPDEFPDVFQDKISAVHIPIQMALDDEHGDTRGGIRIFVCKQCLAALQKSFSQEDVFLMNTGNQQIHAVYQTPAMVSGIRLTGIMFQSPFRLQKIFNGGRVVICLLVTTSQIDIKQRKKGVYMVLHTAGKSL